MGNRITRRTFLAGAAGATAAATTWRYLPRADAADTLFAHGVASGDPLADRVIVWTRVVTTAPIAWEVAAEPEFRSILRSGSTTTSQARDYTVHVDVAGLQPYTDYWYRFRTGGVTSPVGRTRTLPLAGAEVDRMRMGVVTCSELEFGYFGGYRLLAQRDDLDLILALGDYIYEFGTDYGGFKTPKPGGRMHQPAHEIVTLDDYRMRYRQYRADPDLLALHASHPMVVIYDDHEVVNDWWKSGSKDHDPATQGSFAARRDAGMQAFREWLPMRVDPVDKTKVYRRFQFGNLVDLFMLDERLYRDEQPTNAFVGYGSIDPATDDPNRTMLGTAQRDWLVDGLEHSSSKWKVLGNPVSMMPIDVGPALAGALNVLLIALGAHKPPLPPPLLVDGWDGYNAERQRILSAIHDKNIKDVVVLTGDYHESFATELPTDRSQYPLDSNSSAVEFIAPSITSPGLSEVLLMGNLPHAATINTVFEANLLLSNPWVKYHEGFSNGFGVAEFRSDGMQYDFWFVRDRAQPNSAAYAASSWTVGRGAAKLAQAAAPLPDRARALHPSTAPAETGVIPATGSDARPALIAAAGVVAAVGAARISRTFLQDPDDNAL